MSINGNFPKKSSWNANGPSFRIDMKPFWYQNQPKFIILRPCSTWRTFLLVKKRNHSNTIIQLNVDFVSQKIMAFAAGCFSFAHKFMKCKSVKDFSSFIVHNKHKTFISPFYSGKWLSRNKSSIQNLFSVWFTEESFQTNNSFY